MRVLRVEEIDERAGGDAVGSEGEAEGGGNDGGRRDGQQGPDLPVLGLVEGAVRRALENEGGGRKERERGRREREVHGGVVGVFGAALSSDAVARSEHAQVREVARERATEGRRHGLCNAGVGEHSLQHPGSEEQRIQGYAVEQ